MKKEFAPHTDVGLPSFSHIAPLESFDPMIEGHLHVPLKQTASGNSIYDDHPLTLFDLSSHARAREAIEFGLQMRDKGFHVFVLGEERSGRMTSTMSYLKQYVKSMPEPKDWVYLNNFTYAHKPLPFAFKAGQGAVFKTKYAELMENVHHILLKIFTQDSYLEQLSSLQDHFQQQLNTQIVDVQSFANEQGYVIAQSDDGFSVELLEHHTKKLPKKSASEPILSESTEVGALIPQDIRDRLAKIEHAILEANQTLTKKIQHLSRSIAKKKLALPFQRFETEFHPILGDWVQDLRKDILDNLEKFISITGDLAENAASLEAPFYKSERYQVNVFVDNTNTSHGPVILESNPNYDQLFGSIKYNINSNGSPETNFTMMRKGALHSANGGILVLRADALAKNPELWEMLKAALRDHVIRIEERYRDNAMPLLNAPSPTPIPLDIQVFLIASPYWYYNFFFQDPEFRSYFKIKADIEEDMPATTDNVQKYRMIVRHNALKLTGKVINDEAIDFLIGSSTRWSENRHRLSAKFEQIVDVLNEAFVINGSNDIITKDSVHQALIRRRVRNARSEDRSFDEILSGQILIDTQGTSIGQINGLSVISTGDHNFGIPCRISARSYAGDMGILNIERMTDMAGPIQQKGAMILEGFLNGLLAQHFPLSYSCSLTFEQTYGDVDGDSASMAEVIAILSSLSGVPVRQDIAITGSMNQFGISQPIGGTHFKVEGFHRLCKTKGLTGTQGVILPRSNLVNLTLREEVVNDIHEKRFYIWPVDTVFEAIELMLNTQAGVTYDHNGAHSATYPFYSFSPKSVLWKAWQNLKRYHESAQQNGPKRRM